ncbi:hypothetical protein CDAR_532651 [Caerostris darwini]|uniref:Uncharacterized protein n=1 Tax=Caerostris darwini TaxID=1538125 RepID=A0AAV4VY51_9ARAC|nr:hypothetical protein CDAR_532651 [Caerostris darwini]
MSNTEYEDIFSKFNFSIIDRNCQSHSIPPRGWRQWESSATQNSPFSPNIIEDARFRCDGSQSFDIAGRNSLGRLNPVTSEHFYRREAFPFQISNINHYILGSFLKNVHPNKR